MINGTVNPCRSHLDCITLSVRLYDAPIMPTWPDFLCVCIYRPRCMRTRPPRRRWTGPVPRHGGTGVGPTRTSSPPPPGQPKPWARSSQNSTGQSGPGGHTHTHNRAAHEHGQQSVCITASGREETAGGDTQ